ncbi:MAG: 23S rRNA (adenine(2503)-C(2))-methyltransferase RlmN [Deltaproteobacteria bacterium]|nr:23S rRNA (adenine(2503)-C(2))-methyltransferase RlmN [Deltaproteobacteria bacterium]
MNPERVHLKNLSLEGLERFVRSMGREEFRAVQLARWLYQKGARTFAEMTDFSKAFREELEGKAWISFLNPAEMLSSTDGTRKFRFLLADGHVVESVLLAEKDHFTLCLSTQAGCALGCRFCLTGKGGLIRHLEPAEILDQVIGVRMTLGPQDPLTHLVLMGMGEPLENFTSVTQALEIIRSPRGLKFSNRRVTLSTAGIIPRMKELLARPHFVQLAVSLNATTEEQRSRLMPINRRYPLADLLAACRSLSLAHREKITFEYVLLRGVNDTEDDARRLAGLLKGLPAKVNLIPFNEHPGSSFRRPEEGIVQRFRRLLLEKRITATVRQSKGADILGACGQLGYSILQSPPTP